MDVASRRNYLRHRDGPSLDLWFPAALCRLPKVVQRFCGSGPEERQLQDRRSLSKSPHLPHHRLRIESTCLQCPYVRQSQPSRRLRSRFQVQNLVADSSSTLNPPKTSGTNGGSNGGAPVTQ